MQAVIYGICLLQVPEVETHLVLTPAAQRTQAVIDQTVNRILDMLDVELNKDLFPRWQSSTGKGPNHFTQTEAVGVATPV